jgi:hypothetical protein
LAFINWIMAMMMCTCMPTLVCVCILFPGWRRCF